METILFLYENPWALLLAMVPLLMPFETLLILFSLSYAMFIYAPYRLVRALFRKERVSVSTASSEAPIKQEKRKVQFSTMSCAGCGGTVAKENSCAYCGSTILDSQLT